MQIAGSTEAPPSLNVTLTTLELEDDEEDEDVDDKVESELESEVEIDEREDDIVVVVDDVDEVVVEVDFGISSTAATTPITIITMTATTAAILDIPIRLLTEWYKQLAIGRSRLFKFAFCNQSIFAVGVEI